MREAGCRGLASSSVAGVTYTQMMQGTDLWWIWHADVDMQASKLIMDHMAKEPFEIFWMPIMALDVW